MKGSPINLEAISKQFSVTCIFVAMFIKDSPPPKINKDFRNIVEMGDNLRYSLAATISRSKWNKDNFFTGMFFLCSKIQVLSLYYICDSWEIVLCT
jgi:hypothetical protein